MPAWAFWMGIFYLPLGVLALLLVLWMAWSCKSSPIRRIQYLTMAIACLYPVGMGFKLLVLGPEFLRFHLSDIGFPVAMGLLLAWYYIARSAERVPEGDTVFLFTQLLAQLKFRRHILLIMLVVSYGYEALTGYLYARSKGLQVRVVGNFDWVDMLMYTLGVAAACGLLLIASRYANAYLAEAHALREQQAKAARQSSVTAPRPGKRPRKKNRRR